MSYGIYLSLSDLQMNLFTKQKQTHRHRKQTYGYQSGGDNLGFGDWHIHTTIFKIDDQQWPIV